MIICEALRTSDNWHTTTSFFPTDKVKLLPVVADHYTTVWQMMTGVLAPFTGLDPFGLQVTLRDFQVYLPSRPIPIPNPQLHTGLSDT